VPQAFSAYRPSFQTETRPLARIPLNPVAGTSDPPSTIEPRKPARSRVPYEARALRQEIDFVSAFLPASQFLVNYFVDNLVNTNVSELVIKRAWATASHQAGRHVKPSRCLERDRGRYRVRRPAAANRASSKRGCRAVKRQAAHDFAEVFARLEASRAGHSRSPTGGRSWANLRPPVEVFSRYLRLCGKCWRRPLPIAPRPCPAPKACRRTR